MTEHENVLAIIQQKNSVPFSLNPSSTALLIIDVQRYFVQPDYAFGQVFERLIPGVTEGYFRRVEQRVLPHAALRSRIARRSRWQ